MNGLKRFFHGFRNARLYVKEKWKNSTGKEKKLWLSMLILGIYILCPIDILPGVELDDIFAFIGLVGSYFALTDKNAPADPQNENADKDNTKEFVNQAFNAAKNYRQKRRH